MTEDRTIEFDYYGLLKIKVKVLSDELWEAIKNSEPKNFSISGGKLNENSNNG